MYPLRVSRRPDPRCSLKPRDYYNDRQREPYNFYSLVNYSIRETVSAISRDIQSPPDHQYSQHRKVGACLRFFNHNENLSYYLSVLC